MKAKPVWMWACVTRGGYMFAIHSLRRDVIADVIKGSTLTWRQWKRKYGLRIAWVIVREEQQSCEPLLSSIDISARDHDLLDWLIVGGESGPKARPCNVDWIRSIVEQCRAAGVAVFVKQLGTRVIGLEPNASMRGLRDRKGGDWSEWPEDLRVREMPGGAALSE